MIDEALLEKLAKHKDPDVRELVDAYKKLTQNPTVELYKSLYETVNFFGDHIKNKTLDLEANVFQMSAFTFLKDCDKIFNSMEKGRLSFQKEDNSDVQSKKNLAKAEGVPLG